MIRRLETVLPALALLWVGCAPTIEGFNPADPTHDWDGDGLAEDEGDCGDQDDAVHPDAAEVCNALDDNCDGTVDEGFDADGDGYTVCGADGLVGNEDDDCDDTEASLNLDDLDEDGYSSCAGDCDDSRHQVHPGADETCNARDDDCDGALDEDFDADVDGYTSCGADGIFNTEDDDCDDDDPSLNPADADGDGHSTCSGDCDDAEGAVHPGATEECDGLDNDCDGAVTLDEFDVDGDGYFACEECDDEDPALNADDNDGDGFSTCTGDCDDEADYLTPEDTDGDGWSTCAGDCDDGDPSLSPTDVDMDGWSTCDGDCDDVMGESHPGAVEICDGWDNDCDGQVGANEVDTDGDSYLVCEGDCNDNNINQNPGAMEVYCDGLDNDCAEWTGDDVDNDGDGVSYCAGDCDDEDDQILPGAEEICDGLDSDCDGVIEIGEMDNDGDSYYPCSGDCDDSQFLVNPGELEVCNDGVDNDCDGTPNGCSLDVSIDLATADAVRFGENAHDMAGSVVTGAGDVNGDGAEDILISAPQYFSGLPGQAYLVHGPVTGTADLSSADATMVGEGYSDYAGCSVSGVGDVNGDSYADIVIGASGNDDGGGAAGAAYVLYGPLLGITSLASSDAKYTGENGNDAAGSSVAAALDVNSDGYNDFLVGAPRESSGGIWAGAAYLVLGPSPAGGSLATADAKFVGEADFDSAGISTSSAGDLDGDGYDDILIGAVKESTNAFQAGAAYAVYGPILGVVGLAGADAKLLGENDSGWAGQTLAVAGDVNGDGLDDVLVGEPMTQAGISYLLLGPLFGSMDLSSADAVFIGETYQDWAGSALSSAGDVNADGFDDIVIGAYGNDVAGDSAGAAYLVHMPTLGEVSLSSAHTILYGEAVGDHAGSSVSGPGDLNNDGYQDILVGAPYEGPDAGSRTPDLDPQRDFPS